MSLLAGGGVAGAIAIYGASYAFLRARQTALAGHNPLQIAGAHTWLGVNPGKLLNVPIGLVQNIFPVLRNFTGIRALLRGPVFPLISFLAILAALGGFFMLCAAEIWRHRKSLSPLESAAVPAGIVGLAFTLIPVVVFSPNYDKLWLQPLACIALIVTIALAGKWQRTYLRRGVRITTASFLLAGVFTNFLWAIPSHRVRGIYGMAQARQLASIVHKNDLMVGEWSPVPIIYQQLYAANGQYIDFTGQAAQKGEDAVRDLNQAICRTQQNDGHVYFVGLLDHSKAEWDGFLGSRCGVPYSAMNEYRSNSAVVAVLGAGADKIVVRRLR